MSMWSRVVNVFRRGRASREIDEELSAHIQEAIDAGRDPEEARKLLAPASAPGGEPRYPAPRLPGFAAR